MVTKGLLLVLALALSGCAAAVTAATSTPSPSAPTSTPTAAATPTVSPLPPTPAPTAKPTAKPLPRVVACRLRLTVGQDGNAFPLFCSDGDVNLTAWDYFAPIDPRIMSLGGDASYAQFQSAYCADMRSGSTFPIENSGVQLAGRSHGWRFSVVSLLNDDTSWQMDGSC
jgi:hypothetical protein